MIFKTLLTLLFVPTLAFAGLKEDFASTMSNSKGPFGLNYLQGSKNRTTIKSGQYPDKVLFQAAFRDASANALINNYGFYTGNLFTTNYYELMGEYVYGDKNSSHAIDHDALIAQGPQAMPKATSMARHWVLERYYTEHLPNSRLAKAFRYRGISGAEFEAEYAAYFFRFYLQAMSDDLQFLVARLLIQDSPISDESSLRVARDVIAQVYDDYAQKYGADNSVVRWIFKIRNVIHNQVSPEAIKMIDQLLGEQKGLKQDSRFDRVKANLQAYFSFGADKLAEMAKKAGLNAFANSAQAVSSNGPNADNLLALSKELAHLKTALVSEKSISPSVTPQALSVIAKASSYLNNQLSSGPGLGSKQYVEALCNVIYAEGFMIKDNWQYYLSRIQSAENGDLARLYLADVISVATETLGYAFEPALDQWISVEASMDKFKDNTLKSSALNAAAKNL